MRCGLTSWMELMKTKLQRVQLTHIKSADGKAAQIVLKTHLRPSAQRDRFIHSWSSERHWITQEFCLTTCKLLVVQDLFRDIWSHQFVISRGQRKAITTGHVTANSWLGLKPKTLSSQYSHSFRRSTAQPHKVTTDPVSGLRKYYGEGLTYEY